jgi:hypothetical protein
MPQRSRRDANAALTRAAEAEDWTYEATGPVTHGQLLTAATGDGAERRPQAAAPAQPALLMVNGQIPQRMALRCLRPFNSAPTAAWPAVPAGLSSHGWLGRLRGRHAGAPPGSGVPAGRASLLSAEHSEAAAPTTISSAQGNTSQAELLPSIVIAMR